MPRRRAHAALNVGARHAVPQPRLAMAIRDASVSARVRTPDRACQAPTSAAQSHPSHRVGAKHAHHMYCARGDARHASPDRCSRRCPDKEPTPRATFGHGTPCPYTHRNYPIPPAALRPEISFQTAYGGGFETRPYDTCGGALTKGIPRTHWRGAARRARSSFADQYSRHAGTCPWQGTPHPPRRGEACPPRALRKQRHSACFVRPLFAEIPRQRAHAARNVWARHAVPLHPSGLSNSAGSTAAGDLIPDRVRAKHAHNVHCASSDVWHASPVRRSRRCPDEGHTPRATFGHGTPCPYTHRGYPIPPAAPRPEVSFQTAYGRSMPTTCIARAAIPGMLRPYGQHRFAGADANSRRRIDPRERTGAGLKPAPTETRSTQLP
jgi:hypothetical protein